jgi:riboflavin kinase/FMN adenylyltransferase
MDNGILDNRVAVAMGDFDGMHRAHKIVATGAKNVTIFCVNNRFSLLQKSIFERRYPNAVFADFNLIKNLNAQEFVEDVLIGKYNVKMVLCGFNFRFGKNAMWSAMDLRKYLEEKDIWVRILEHEDYNGKPISSTRIRSEIIAGNIQTANEMLGYNFTFENEVVKGDQRGRTIGFPTINQHWVDGLVVPKFGVYQSVTYVGSTAYKSFSNIGVRPTWQTDEPMVETHIFDFSGDLYGKTVRVELLKYLREEKVFSSVDELKKQLIYDKSSIV